MGNHIDNFWNEVAMAQMAAGKAPSVVTKDMRKALDGDKEAADKIKQEIDVEKAINEGVEFHNAQSCSQDIKKIFK